MAYKLGGADVEILIYSPHLFFTILPCQIFDNNNHRTDLEAFRSWPSASWEEEKYRRRRFLRENVLMTINNTHG